MELNDYSGEYDPEFSHEKLSREMLIKLLKVYSEYVLKIDGYWYMTILNRWGNDEALNCDIAVWERAKLFELKAMTEAYNIHGDNIATLMKYIQTHPWITLSEYEIDVKNANYATLTHFTCPTLFAIEKEGSGREKRQCSEVDFKFFKVMAHHFNPDIQVTPLKLPPRESLDDICCKWEFKLDR